MEVSCYKDSFDGDNYKKSLTNKIEDKLANFDKFDNFQIKFNGKNTCDYYGPSSIKEKLASNIIDEMIYFIFNLCKGKFDHKTTLKVELEVVNY